MLYYSNDEGGQLTLDIEDPTLRLQSKKVMIYYGPGVYLLELFFVYDH